MPTGVLAGVPVSSSRRDRQLSTATVTRTDISNAGLRGSGRYRMEPNFADRRVGLRAVGRKASSTASTRITFPRADTLDETHKPAGRGTAVCGSGQAGDKSYAVGSCSLLGSSNRNLLDDEQSIARASAGRSGVEARPSHRSTHQLIGAVESEREEFDVTAIRIGGFTNQDRRAIIVGRRRNGERQARPGQSPTSLFATISSPRSRMRPPCALVHGRTGERSRDCRQLWRRDRAADLLRSVRLFSGSLHRQSGPEAGTSRGGEISLRYRRRQARRVGHLLPPAAEG